MNHTNTGKLLRDEIHEHIAINNNHSSSSTWNQSSSSLNTPTTGSKSFLPKFTDTFCKRQPCSRTTVQQFYRLRSRTTNSFLRSVAAFFSASFPHNCFFSEPIWPYRSFNASQNAGKQFTQLMNAIGLEGRQGLIEPTKRQTHCRWWGSGQEATPTLALASAAAISCRLRRPTRPGGINGPAAGRRKKVLEVTSPAGSRSFSPSAIMQ